MQQGDVREFNGLSLDCLIWAGATEKSPNLPARWLYDSQIHAKPLHIVDFKDKSKSQSLRTKDYERNNIFETGVSVKDGHINQLLRKIARGENHEA